MITIAPGIMDTPLLANAPQELRDSLAKLHVFPQRLGTPEDFAHLVTAIVENQMLNGEVIRLDAAARMPPPDGEETSTEFPPTRQFSRGGGSTLTRGQQNGQAGRTDAGRLAATAADRSGIVETMIRIALVSFDGMEELDLVGPWEVLRGALRYPDDGVEVFTVSLDGETVTCAKGMQIVTDEPVTEVGVVDVLLMPGERARET